MISSKNKYISSVNELIEQKINEVWLALQIKMIKEDSYEEIKNKFYLFIYKKIKSSFINNIDNFNDEQLLDRIEILIKNYLKNFQ